MMYMQLLNAWLMNQVIFLSRVPAVLLLIFLGCRYIYWMTESVRNDVKSLYWENKIRQGR